MQRIASCVSLTLLGIAAGAAEFTSATQAPQVVTASEMNDRGGALNTTDWLRELPGIRVYQTAGGLDGGQADIRMRGLAGTYAQLRLDGIPVNDPATPSGDFNASLFNPSAIASVITTSGPQSARVGSRAMAGVVAVTSIRPTRTHQQAYGVGGGSFNTASVALQATGPLGLDNGYAASFDALTSHGFSSQTGLLDGDPSSYEYDPLQRLSMNLRLEHRPHAELALYVALSAMRTKQFLDQLGANDPHAARNQDFLRISGGGSTKLAAATICSFDLALTESIQRLDTWYGPKAITPHPIVGPSTYDPAIRVSRGRELSASCTLTTDMGDDCTLSSGIDARRDLASHGYRDHSLDWSAGENIGGLFLTGGYHGDRWQVELAGRFDYHEQSGTFPSGRCAVAWVPMETGELTMRTAVSSGFRAPSLYETNGKNRVGDFGFGPVYFSGNSALKQEQLTNIEVGADLHIDKDLALHATTFHWRFTDKIERDFVSTPNTYTNLDDDTSLTGIETGLRAHDIGQTGIDVDATYSSLDSSDGHGSSLAYAPREFANARITAHQRPAAWLATWVSIGASHTGFYYGFDQDKGYIPSYTTVQLATGMTLDNTWDVALLVDNLLNKRYGIAPPFDTDGDTTPDHRSSSQPRTYYLTVRARF